MSDQDTTAQTTHAFHRATPGDSATPPPSLIKKMIAKVPLNLLRFWWIFVLIPGLAIATASVVATAIASTSWTFKSTILYTPIPVGVEASNLYTPPDLRTMATMLTSPVVIQRVCEDLDLEIPPRTLAKMVTIEEPKSMQRIGLQLGWSDPDEGRLILDALAKAYGEHISTIRRELVGGYLSDLEGSLSRNAKRLADAQEALRQFNSRENVRDAETDLEDLIGGISALEYKLETELRNRKDLEAQEGNMRDRLDQQKQEEAMESQAAKEAEAAEESVADNRRRQDRLNELIEEERRLNEIRAALFAAQQEFDRKVKLYDKGYISRAEFESIDAEVKALKSKIMEGANIEKWKQELKTIDQVVVPDNGKKRKGSPVIQQTLFKLIEIELDILSSDTQTNEMRLTIAEKRRGIRRLQALEQESTRLAKAVDSASAEQDLIEGQMIALEAIRDYGTHEFTVIAPATSSMHHPASNKQKFFILIFGAMTVSLSAPFVLLAILLSFKQTVDEGCADRGFPVVSPRKSILAMLTDNESDPISELQHWCRHVALRIQQYLPRRGAVVSIYSAGHRRRDVELLNDIGSVLVARDEKVIVVESSAPIESEELELRRSLYEDAPAASRDLLEDVQAMFSKSPEGLFDYLEDDSVTAAAIIRPGSELNCDYISIGHQDGRFDRIFSSRMNQLVAELRERYSVIFIYGPELHRTIDVEMQTRHSDGILFLHDRGEPLWHGLRDSLESLVELGAPVWGSLARPRGFTAPSRPRLRKRVLAQTRQFVSRLLKQKRHNRHQNLSLTKRQIAVQAMLSTLKAPVTVLGIIRRSLAQVLRRQKAKQNEAREPGTTNTDTSLTNSSEQSPHEIGTGKSE